MSSALAEGTITLRRGLAVKPWIWLRVDGVCNPKLRTRCGGADSAASAAAVRRDNRDGQLDRLVVPFAMVDL